ncbi:MOSC domain-containing protein [Virgibacillus dakarensis]|uniref:MOSC domain-containing protein n=1 Tax=Virgibacillus dakarensis TaxID=1917889 RepID=UPI002E11AA50
MMNAPYVDKLLTGKVKKMGRPNAEERMDRLWESGMFKNTVDAKVWLGKSGLAEDEVADTKNHGGPEKAIFSYPMNHYDDWRRELDLASIGVGAMGENLSVMNMDEKSVCIGDTYKFGDTIIQVSQPRRPCWKPARRFRIIDFALRIQNSGRTGWYFRVLQEGFVQAGMELELVERPYPNWTIAACNEIMYVKKGDVMLAEELASCEFLAENWKRTLHKRLAGRESSIEKRVYGPNKN